MSGAVGEVQVRLRVNGEERVVDVDPSTPLLYVLRNDLGLRAAKFGCGLEQCGACTVLVDGEAVQSCVSPVGTFAGSNVTTLEGLVRDGRLHPVQEAFLAERAAQCGYCIPGMIVEVAALLARTPHPSDEDMRQALDGHLCRCGTHTRVLRAVRRAANGGAG